MISMIGVGFPCVLRKTDVHDGPREQNGSA
jgi:hypothetical protein